MCIFHESVFDSGERFQSEEALCRTLSIKKLVLGLRRHN